MSKKFDSKPIDKSDIQDFINQGTSSFPFEMEILSLASEIAGSENVHHAGLYTDPETKKTRQFDLRVLISTVSLHFLLAIECKRLTEDHPLVISRMPRRAPESFHELVYVPPEEPIDRFQPITPREKTVRISGFESAYGQGELVGKSLDQLARHAQTGQLVASDNEVYSKWSQALAQAADLVMIATGDETIAPEEEVLSFVLPILVVPEETLWSIDYDLDGNLLPSSPAKCTNAEYYVGFDSDIPMSVTYTISHLHIMTPSYLKRFLKEVQYSDSSNFLTPNWRRYIAP